MSETETKSLALELSKKHHLFGCENCPFSNFEAAINEAIERCAQEAENNQDKLTGDNVCNRLKSIIAMRIRALK